MRDNGVDKSPNTRKQLRNCISPLLPRKKSIIYPKKLGFFRLTRLSQNSIGTLKIRKGRKRTWPQNLGFLVCSSVRLKRYQSQFHSFFFFTLQMPIDKQTRRFGWRVEIYDSLCYIYISRYGSSGSFQPVKNHKKKKLNLFWPDRQNFVDSFLFLIFLP